MCIRDRISILDVTGKTVALLHKGKMASGKHNITWEIKSASGGKLSSGSYFVKLESATMNEVKKIIVTDK